MPKPNMCHGKVHDQGARRREEVMLSLRFLQDDIVFDLDVSSFLAHKITSAGVILLHYDYSCNSVADVIL